MAIGLATVFGGSGFLGRYLVRALAQTGARVRVAVRRPDEAAFLRVSGGVGQVMSVAANVRDDASVAAAVANADVVVNFTGLLYQSGRQSFHAIHVDGAARVARAAQAAGVPRLIHVSAVGADPTSPSAYGRTKAAGERAVQEAFKDATIVRPSIVFGPEDDFFNRFAAMAKLAPALPLIGGGRTRFQPVFAGDVADGMMAILDDETTRGRMFEFGGPETYSFADLMRYILTVTGRRRLLVPVPFFAAELLGAIAGLAPVPPITRDQMLMLRRDNVVAEGAATLADLGIAPTPLEIVVPGYLTRYARHGRPGHDPHALA